MIFLDPPLEYSRQVWIRQLHEWLGKLKTVSAIDFEFIRDALGIVCRQRRVQSSRYEIGLQLDTFSKAEETYTSLVRAINEPHGSVLLMSHLMPALKTR